MRQSRQKGFSLLELLVAMTILAVIGTLGFTQVRKHSAKARYLKAHDNVETVGKGLDQYYLKHGSYPELGSYEAMIGASSPLVREDFIPANAPAKDPWGQPFEGTASKGNYTLKCLGDPSNPEEFGPFTVEPGRSSESSSPAAPASGAPPAGETPK